MKNTQRQALQSAMFKLKAARLESDRLRIRNNAVERHNLHLMRVTRNQLHSARAEADSERRRADSYKLHYCLMLGIFVLHVGYGLWESLYG